MEGRKAYLLSVEANTYSPYFELLCTSHMQTYVYCTRCAIMDLSTCSKFALNMRQLFSQLRPVQQLRTVCIYTGCFVTKIVNCNAHACEIPPPPPMTPRARPQSQCFMKRRGGLTFRSYVIFWLHTLHYQW